MLIVGSTLDGVDVRLNGIAEEAAAPSFAQRGQAGVVAFATTLSASGGVDIRGIGSADSGVLMSPDDVVTSGRASLNITGDTTAATVPGLIVPATLGGSSQTGDIVLRARNGGSTDSIALYSTGDGTFVGNVTTSGTLALVPGGLSTGATAVVTANAIPINVGLFGAGGFGLDPTDLSAIGAGTRSVVIGSDTHTWRDRSRGARRVAVRPDVTESGRGLGRH